MDVFSFLLGLYPRRAWRQRPRYDRPTYTDGLREETTGLTGG